MDFSSKTFARIPPALAAGRKFTVHLSYSKISITVRRSALPKCILLNGQRAVLRLSSYLCVGRIKIVKQAAEVQADSKSNRISVKLYRIEARYFVPECTLYQR